MPQNRAQYTFGQLITLVVELKSSVKSLKSDLDKIHKSKIDVKGGSPRLRTIPIIMREKK